MENHKPCVITRLLGVVTESKYRANCDMQGHTYQNHLSSPVFFRIQVNPWEEVFSPTGSQEIKIPCLEIITVVNQADSHIHKYRSQYVFVNDAI